MMELFYSNEQPAVELAQALDLLQIHYKAHNVDEQQQAHQRLFDLIGAITVPALVLGNGNVLIQPTPAQFAQSLRTIREQHDWAWQPVAVAFLAGLIGFAGSAAIARLFAPGAIAVLLLLTVVVLIGLGLLGVVPLVKAFQSTLMRHPLGAAARQAVLSFYILVVGLSVQQPINKILSAVTVAAISTTILVMVLRFSRPIWMRWADRLVNWHARLGTIGLVLAVLLVVGVVVLHGLPAFQQLVALPSLLLMALLLIFGGIQVAQGRREVHPIDQASMLLFPVVALMSLFLR